MYVTTFHCIFCKIRSCEKRNSTTKR